MRTLEYPKLGEIVQRRTLSNGLELVVAQKAFHAKRYAFFATRYGGMDMRFALDGQWLDTPAGIASIRSAVSSSTRIRVLPSSSERRPSAAPKRRVDRRPGSSSALRRCALFRRPSARRTRSLISSA